MSLLASRGREELEPDDDAHPNLDLVGPEYSTQHEISVESSQPAEAKAATDPLNAFINSMQECEYPHHFHMICKGGVMRMIRHVPRSPNQETDIEIFDAKPMSPELIKSWLDREP
ncbi:hypothetical protein G6011_02937 [Alternaria panax]|uniref:Uncharacterized protein n=1 Tax=Alternaria panax TaxID=48097 RepID=A0AAD4FB59_9PLEO|nr:hypothetical protein G6011_02937 [Alternaria panax]